MFAVQIGVRFTFQTFAKRARLATMRVIWFARPSFSLTNQISRRFGHRARGQKLRASRVVLLQLRSLPSASDLACAHPLHSYRRFGAQRRPAQTQRRLAWPGTTDVELVSRARSAHQIDVVVVAAAAAAAVAQWQPFRSQLKQFSVSRASSVGGFGRHSLSGLLVSG